MKARAYIASFGCGYLGASLLEAYRQGSLPTSLKPVKDAAAIVPVDRFKYMLYLTSPVFVSGFTFIAVSRIWQASSALVAVTSANQVMGRLLGLSGIAVSGVYSAAALRHYCLGSTPISSASDILTLPFSTASDRTIFKDACITLAAYAILGGSWRHLVPSSVLYKGSFANSKLLSLLSQKTLAQGKSSSREMVSTLGGYNGCHSCGVRRGHFVADLSPPTEVISQQKISKMFMTHQDYIPQCVPCSGKQASALRRWQDQPWYERQLIGHSAVVTHFGAFRKHDLTGVALGLVITPLLYQQMK